MQKQNIVNNFHVRVKTAEFSNISDIRTLCCVYFGDNIVCKIPREDAGGSSRESSVSPSCRKRRLNGAVFCTIPIIIRTQLIITGPTFLYGESETPPHLVAFYDHAGDTEDTFST